jgi:hypothetical protein
LDQVATLLRPGSAQLFTSIDLWDICALIAHSRAYCGSSLHGRIVATAFALPRVNLRPPASKGHSGKQAAYAATWDDAGLPAEVEPRDSGEAIYTALAVEPEGLRHQARRLARLYRKGFMAMCPGLT